MKYHYEKPEIAIPVYGEKVLLNDHPIYFSGTLFSENGKGFIVVQQHFDSETKNCWWGAVDSEIANDIYTSPYFHKFFATFAKETDYNCFQLRSVMWKLRMKPLKKEEWEKCFGTT